MRYKTQFLAALLMAAASMLYIFPHHFHSAKVGLISASTARQPLQLRIPAIELDAHVESVTITKDGSLDVPHDPADAAWFEKGPRPGEVGSAVIDGHSGWADSIPAVFDKLYQLHIGDHIYVDDAAGHTTIFIIQKMRVYDSHADTSSIFTSHDGKAHLNLITCSGAWDPHLQASADRLVVFAVKI